MFAAARARRPALWGKAVVFATVTLVLRVPSVLGTLLIGQSILASKRPQAKLDRQHSSRGDRRGFLPHRCRAAGDRSCCIAAQHRRGHLGPVRPALRHPDRRALPSVVLGRSDQQLPARQRGACSPSRPPGPGNLAPRTGFGLFSAYANAGTSAFGRGTGDDHSVANAQPSRWAIVTSSRSAALAPTVALPFRSHVSTENHERQH